MARTKAVLVNPATPAPTTAPDDDPDLFTLRVVRNMVDALIARRETALGQLNATHKAPGRATPPARKEATGRG